jgi:hypothetical protein
MLDAQRTDLFDMVTAFVVAWHSLAFMLGYGEQSLL